MCGIFAYTGAKKNAADMVLSGLKSLEYRGYDSWGVAAHQQGTVIVQKKIGKIGGAALENTSDTTCALGHTRWATHGGVTDENAHPHLDCSGKIALVHNGIFENYSEYKHQLTSHKIVSETDSEVIVHLIEDTLKTLPFAEAVRTVFNKMEGFNAVIVMNITDESFVVIKKGSPLVIGFGEDENYVASDAAALLPYTKQVYFMNDDDMAIVKKNGVTFVKASTNSEFTPEVQTLNWSEKQAEKGQYPYFMLKEIYDQPDVILDIAESDSAQIEKLVDQIKQSDNTYFIGCGTAYYSTVAAAYLFSKIASKSITPVIGSEFTYQQDFLNEKSLVVAVSQSGETMDILEAIRMAKAKHAKTAALVNVTGSSLYREVDTSVALRAGIEKGVASTKAFIAMLSNILLASYAYAGKLEDGKKELSHIAQAVSEVLDPANVKKLQTLAHALKDETNMFIVGRGLSYPSSLEAALKIKETSYIHAEGFAAGELKHGVLALIEKGTPTIVFAPTDETYSANIAGAMELKARGAMVIGVSPKPHEVFDIHLPVVDVGHGSIIPNIVTIQLLSYYLTIEKGLDPDMPRNLAKSVTVK